MSNDTSAKRNIQKLQRLIVDALEGVKGQDIQVFNTETLSALFERVIVASGTSNRQTRALAMAVREAVKDAGFVKPRLEGEDNGEWIIVDCGQAVVHVMQPIIRQYYRLEELWGETPVRLAGGKRVASHAKTFAREVAAVEEAPKAKSAKGAKPSAKVAAKVTPAGAKKTSPKPSIAPAKAAPKAGAKTAVNSAVKAVRKVVAKAAATPSAKAPAKAVKPSTPKAPSKTVVVKKIVVKAKAAPAKKAAAKRAPRARAS